MRLVIAAGLAAAFTGCAAKDQTVHNESREARPRSQEVSRDAPAPAEVLSPRFEPARSIPIAFDVEPFRPRTRNGDSDATDGDGVSGPVIVILRSRDGRVTVHSSEAGPLFTITDNAGAIEASQISYVELQDRYPDYYRAFRNSIAADGRMYAGYYPDPANGEGVRDSRSAPRPASVLEVNSR